VHGDIQTSPADHAAVHCVRSYYHARRSDAERADAGLAAEAGGDEQAESGRAVPVSTTEHGDTDLGAERRVRAPRGVLCPEYQDYGQAGCLPTGQCEVHDTVAHQPIISISLQEWSSHKHILR